MVELSSFSAYVLLGTLTFILGAGDAWSQGRVSLPPTVPFAAQLPELGRMTGGIRKSVRQASGEEFGREIWSVGDLNNDGLNDWVVERRRCDTLLPPSTAQPIEILLFRGVPGKLPPYQSGQRIGPIEVGSQTHFLAAGDFDADGLRDIVVAVNWLNDTTDSDSSAEWVKQKVIVFWGDSAGTYSVNDTTQLQGGGTSWLGARAARAADFDGDSIDDLLVHSTFGFSARQFPRTPRLQLFHGGPGRRWGRGSVAARSAWHIKELPGRGFITVEDRFDIIDQNCDGALDIALNYTDEPGEAWVSVYYGAARGGFPDTVPQTIAPTVSNARSSMFADITGDGSPELLINCGGAGRVRIFAGRPGRGLLHQYGSGWDSPMGDEWWNRPWAEIWSPDLIDSGWTPSGFHPFLNFGDMSEDGVPEIWTWSNPYVLGYGGMHTLDSLADAWTSFPGQLQWTAALGDIDGSGRQTVAMSYDRYPHDYDLPFPGEIIFLQSTAAIPHLGQPRTLPHIAGERCGVLTTAAPTYDRDTNGSISTTFDGTTNTLTVTAHDGQGDRELEYQIVNVLGVVIVEGTTALRGGRAVLKLRTIRPGYYVIQVGANTRRSWSFVVD